ncbi:hypothetical protein DH2020_040985 [Rehmannia glutinosa]|uniref:DUF4283 domain-containing protein n=1 Tax=Rehmannia glutinosa TaxID=99300 RepID=A0ABR0US19_REHGL
MRVFKWTPSFNPRAEAPLAPVWIRFPGLPIHFFDHNALFAIGMIIARLQVDSRQRSRSRLSMARVCVELDLLKERIDEIVLEFDDTSQVDLKNGNSNNILFDFANKKDQLVIESAPRHDKDNKKWGSTIPYFNQDNLAEEHASLNGLNGLENAVSIPSAVNGSHTCLNYSIPTLSSFEKNKDAHGLYSGVVHASDENFRATENRSSSQDLNMAEIVGDNMVNGSIFLTDLEPRVIKGEKGGALSDYITPTFSKSSTLLEGFIGHLNINGHLKGPTTTPFLAKKVDHGQHTLVEQLIDKVGQTCSIIGNLHGPTSLSSHAKKVENSLHPYELDGNNIMGPNNSSLPCALINYQLGPSAASNMSSPDEGSHAKLGQHYCLNEAHVFSSNPAQSSSAVVESTSNSYTQPSNLNHSSSPNNLITQVQPAMSSLPYPDDVSSAHNVVDPTPLAGDHGSSDLPCVQLPGDHGSSDLPCSNKSTNQNDHTLPYETGKKFNSPINTSKSPKLSRNWEWINFPSHQKKS